MIKTTLPFGYHYKTDSYGVSEGIVISVDLVKSNYKAGGLLDRMFGEVVLTYACKVSREVTADEMDVAVAELKQSINEQYFSS